MNIDEIMGKIKDSAVTAAEITAQALSNAKHTIDKTLSVAALNSKINRILSGINNEYISIGKLVYEAHLNPEASSEGIDDMLERIDELNRELEETKEERDRRKAE